MGANNPTASTMTMVSGFGLGAIDIGKAFHDAPPKLDFIWPGFLAGTVGGLFSAGGVGKSYWTLEAAMAIACSVAGGDLVGLSSTHAGRVVYLAGEDPAPIQLQRIHAIGRHLNPSARSEISRNLSLVPVLGKRLNVMDESHLSWLIEYCANARLIVIDTLSRIHKLDENSNGDMAHLITMLEHVAAITGASVLYLHHVSKASVRDGQAGQQHAARGASALVDNARWAGYVAKMTEDEARRLSVCPNGRQPIGTDRCGLFMRFGVSKQNYNATSMERWYERQEGGVLVPVKLMEARSGSGKKREKRDEL